MSNVLLKRCTSCKEYTLQETCPRCGAKAKPNRPAKFSPEDNYGDYRRKLKRMDQAKGPGNSDSERHAGAQAASPPTKPPMTPNKPASAGSAPSGVPSGRGAPATKKPKGA